MIEKLRGYIDELFSDAPLTKKTVEVKEEILQNLTEKYNDLIAEGKSEDAAYNITVAGIGDISELIQELKSSNETRSEYIIDPQRKKEKQRSAALVAIAIMLYILSLIPVILSPGVSGAIIMLLLIAAATGLLIYNGMTRSNIAKKDETLAAEFKEWRESNNARKSALRSITPALWSITLVIYFLVSFETGAWYITWLIFIIAAAVNNIIKTFFDYKK